MCLCRICLDDVVEEERKRYCNCSGSNAYVHFECLEKWIRGNNYKRECEICKSNYRFNYVPVYPGILTVEFSCVLVTLLTSIVVCIIVWYLDSDSALSKKDYIVLLKNSSLYLPIIFTQILKIKYNKSRKVLSYKLSFIDVDEQTPLIESGNSNQPVDNEEERYTLSINSSLDCDEVQEFQDVPLLSD